MWKVGQRMRENGQGIKDRGIWMSKVGQRIR